MIERLIKLIVILMLIIAVVCYVGLFFDADEIDWWVSGTFTTETILGFLVIILSIIQDAHGNKIL
jgi:hypothetical protein